MKRFTLDRSTVVVITGASSGIGRAAALAFAERQVRLVLAGRRLDSLQEVAIACERLGAGVLPVEADTGDAGSVLRIAEMAAVAFGGRIDVWVNNAGVAAFGQFTETPVEAHERVIRTNLMGYLHGAHAALPYFLAQDSGVLINVVSMAGWAPTPLASSYSASKFGNRGFSEALRVELAGRPRIRVCDLYPAFVDTPMLEHVANYTGRALKPVPPVISSQAVARRIVGLAERPRDANPMGVAFPITTGFHSAFPRLFRWSVGRAAKLYLALARRSPVTEAALYAPPGHASGTDGGLRSPPARLGLIVACAAGLALGVAWRSRLRAAPG